MDPETDVSFLPMEAVGEFGGLDLDRTRPLSKVVDGYTYFRDGDVVVAKITPCFENGKGALATDLSNGLGFGTTELHVLRAHDGLDNRYLFYLTISHRFRKLGESTMYGAGGQKRVSDDFIREYRHELPPLAIQRAIAAFLDRETAKIDALIEKKRRLLNLLDEKRTALITRAVTRGLDPDVPMKDSGVEWLGEIPAHWDVVFLDKVVAPTRPITYGIVQPGERDPDGRFMVRGQDYSDGWTTPEKVFKVSPEIERPYRRARLKSGDLVVTIVGAGTGNVATVPDWLDGANITQTTARVAADASVVDADFLRPVLESKIGQANVDLAVKGAAQPGLNLSHLAKFRIPLPPLAEQARIAALIETHAQRSGALQTSVGHAISLLQEYRTALISAAVTGQLDVSKAAA